MTLEANPLSVPVDRDPAWPFLEELDAGQIMTVCAKAAELRRVENKSLSAGNSYRELLLYIPLAESASVHGVPRYSEGDSNYFDLKDISIGDKVDMFLAFQRRVQLMLADPTAVGMLKEGVMSIVVKSAAQREGSAIETLLKSGLVETVDDLQKPEIRRHLDPQTLGYLQAYLDYTKVFPVASSQKPPQML